jgi:undecaprenyl-diphosphatase
VHLLKVIFLAVLQGVTELFPVSSLGNAVVWPHLLRMNLDVESDSYLPLLVMLHVGTAIALFVYFRDDWFRLLGGVLHREDPERREERNLLTLLVLATIPAGLLGLIFEHRLKTLFEDYRYAASFLIVNGCMLALGEWLRRRKRLRGAGDLRVWQAVVIGTAQAGALFPGISRSGATFVGGLLAGLTHEEAARFGFLLATPIIGAAGVLEVPKLLREENRGDIPSALLGGVIAGVVAYASTWVLMRYFHRNDVNALLPFAIYSAALGVLTLIIG